jgi:hypothetical protein
MRLKGYKPEWLIENVYACDSGLLDKAYTPSEGWDEVLTEKREDNAERGGYGTRPVYVLADGVDYHSSGNLDGCMVLVDGHHRVVGALDAGERYVPAVLLAEWYSCRDIVWHSHGCDGCEDCENPKERVA